MQCSRSLLPLTLLKIKSIPKRIEARLWSFEFIELEVALLGVDLENALIWLDATC